jgi:hypothetical protein
MAKKLNIDNFCGKYGAFRQKGYRAPIRWMIESATAAEPLTDLIVLDQSAGPARISTNWKKLGQWVRSIV